MKRFLLILLAVLSFQITTAQNRFPKPDFETAYQYPVQEIDMSHQAILAWVDLGLMTILMAIVAWAAIGRRSRGWILGVSLFSVLYFGFIRSGCICSVGSLQNVALALGDVGYAIPLTIIGFFLLPIIFTLLFGRVFCGGVCPLGALQELVNIRNYRLSRALSLALGILPWFVLAFAILFAATGSGFLVCRFDPFIGIFRLSGEFGLLVFGVLLLIAAVFTGRPFCRFLCPYGAILGFVARFSIWHIKITAKPCINCDLCRNCCPTDAILPPQEGVVNEKRSRGVRRILLYIVILPISMAVMGLASWSIADELSLSNKTVALNQMVIQGLQTLDVETFLSQGGNIDQLAAEAQAIQSQFRRLSLVMGALIGLIISLTLLNLSLKRRRTQYSIAASDCLSCGKCINYCPQNKK